MVEIFLFFFFYIVINLLVKIIIIYIYYFQIGVLWILRKLLIDGMKSDLDFKKSMDFILNF